MSELLAFQPKIFRLTVITEAVDEVVIPEPPAAVAKHFPMFAAQKHTRLLLVGPVDVLSASCSRDIPVMHNAVVAALVEWNVTFQCPPSSEIHQRAFVKSLAKLLFTFTPFKEGTFTNDHIPVLNRPPMHLLRRFLGMNSQLTKSRTPDFDQKVCGKVLELSAAFQSTYPIQFREIPELSALLKGLTIFAQAKKERLVRVNLKLQSVTAAMSTSGEGDVGELMRSQIISHSFTGKNSSDMRTINPVPLQHTIHANYTDLNGALSGKATDVPFLADEFVPPHIASDRRLLYKYWAQVEVCRPSILSTYHQGGHKPNIHFICVADAYESEDDVGSAAGGTSVGAAVPLATKLIEIDPNRILSIARQIEG